MARALTIQLGLFLLLGLGLVACTPRDVSDVAAIFIHDEDDPIVSRAAVQDGVDMWEAAGQVHELAYDHERGHEYVPELLHPRMLGFFEAVCNDSP